MVRINRDITLDNPTAWGWAKKFIDDNYQALIEKKEPLSIIITNNARRRNSEQNKRYWRAVLQPIAEQVWAGGRQFDKTAWHELYAEKYGYFEEVELPDGVKKLRRKSTSEYSVKEFSEYMTKIEVDAAQEYGVRFYVRSECNGD